MNAQVAKDALEGMERLPVLALWSDVAFRSSHKAWKPKSADTSRWHGR